MKICSVAKGMEIISGGALYELQRRLKDQSLYFEHCETRQPLSFPSDAAFVNAVANNVVMIPNESQRKPIPFEKKLALPTGKRDFGALPTEAQAAAQRAWGYVKAALAAGVATDPHGSRQIQVTAPSESTEEALPCARRRTATKTLAQVIEVHAKRKEDKKPPKESTVWSWIRKCRRNGFTVHSLVPSYTGRPVGLEAAIEELMEGAIQEWYLTDQKLSKVKAFDKFLEALTKVNTERKAKGERLLQKPGRRTFERRIDAIPAYIRVLRRYGIDEARRRFRAQTQAKTFVSRILECVQIDHTLLDVIVCDDDMKVMLGRPWLTVAIDMRSGMCLGFYITLKKPSMASVFACLLHAISPKAYMKEIWPHIKGEWPCWGLPEMILVDNGMEFHAEDLQAALCELNIDVSYAPRKTPWLKAMVERFMKAIAEELIHSIPGTTFSNPDERRDYKSEKHARLRFRSLIMLIHQWVVTVHSKRTSDFLGKPRIDAWMEGMEAHPPFLPCDFEELRRILSERLPRVLSNKGVVINHLPYGSAELNMIRKMMGIGENETVDVTVLYDRRDLGSVHVVIPGKAEAIRVPCLYPQYAEGLSAEMHKLVMKSARVKFKSAEKELALSIAQAELLTAIREETRSRKLATLSRVASRVGVNSEDVLVGDPKSVGKFLAKKLPAIPLLAAKPKAHSGMQSETL